MVNNMVTEIDYAEVPKIKDVVLIQGIAPGVGYIGRNVAGYLVSELKAKKFAELYSDALPPVVNVDHNGSGLIITMKYELYYVKGDKKKKQKDMVIVVGDAQSMTTEGYYEIARSILEFLEEMFGIKEVISIGGFGTGMLVEKRKPHVYGAANNEKYLRLFEKLGVKFKNTEVTQIVGAAGVIVGEATRMEIDAVCLMGETSGLLLSDPKATEAVLEVLNQYLNLDLDLSKIQEHVKEVEKVLKKIDEMQKKAFTQLMKKKEGDDEHLGYIG
ncbi:MAG: proteasome assembly chaperone family protein [Candidatus Nanohaloarchaeota archaeon]|nr:proteasome assembly chaperone family protein [Candidatus Nanohaloarchaeota archaeon]